MFDGVVVASFWSLATLANLDCSITAVSLRWPEQPIACPLWLCLAKFANRVRVRESLLAKVAKRLGGCT